MKARENIIWGAPPRNLPAIDLNDSGQIALFAQFSAYYQDMPFREKPAAGLRYYFDNPWFTHADAIVLYSMMRHLRPRRVIEIGSGFSSAVILDTSDLFLDSAVACTFIDPGPERLLALFKNDDRQRHSVITSQLQDVDLDLFRQLEANDILFVDSSHVSKINSDVNRIFFDILPILNQNVVVHFHDIFYPFEYPREWVYLGVAWNENYLLRAFLQYNQAFEIQFFNSYFGHLHRDLLAKEMPLCLSLPAGDMVQSIGGSFWMKKVIRDGG